MRAMIRSNIYTAPSEKKGRGVFASVEFERGDIIELCPVILISMNDRKIIHETGLHDYYFVWGDEDDMAAIALGYGSLYNHSDTPNAQFINDLENDLIIMECLKPIKPGDEIFINYVDHRSTEQLWFKNKE